MQSKSITVNGAYSVFAKVFSMVVPIVTMPYILRTLGVESYGKIAYIQSLVSYFTLLATLGLSDLSLRECSIFRNDPLLLKKSVSQLFTLSLFSTGLSLCIYFGYVFLVPDARNSLLLYAIYSFIIISSGTNMSWLYSVLERFDLSSIRDVIGKILYLILVFMLIRGTGDYVLYGAVFVFSTCLVPYLINHFDIWSGKCGVTPRLLIDDSFLPHLRSIFYLGLMTFGSKLFSSADTILVKWLVSGNGDNAAGLYQAGITLPLVIEQLLFTIATVITPRLYRLLGNGEEQQTQQLTNKISNAMYFVAVPAVLTCFFFPKELMCLLGGESYFPAANVVRIYSLILLTAIAITLAGTRTYLARRKEKKLFKILFSMAILNICLDFAFIRMWGIIGAAIATTVSNVLLMTIELSMEKSWGLVFTREKINYLKGAIAIIAVFALVKYFSAPLSIISLFIAIGIAGILYISVMCFYKESTILIALSKIYYKKA